MTLQQLKYALTIADCGSMNEAAKQLFISQPSLSETMKELETEIGLDIFLRSNRGIVITPEGEEFLGYARQVTEQFGLLQSKYIDKKVKEKYDYITVEGSGGSFHTALYVCGESVCGDGQTDRYGTVRICSA